MVFRIVALSIVLLSGCASAPSKVTSNDLGPSKKTKGLYLGHSQYGSVVIAANHYEAMSGLPVSSSELGIADRKGAGNDMLCAREIIVGSHVPRWVCRYQDEAKLDRQQTQDWLNQPRMVTSTPSAALPGIMVGRGYGGGSYKGPSVP